jgi:molecular chaperone DnaK
VAADCEYLGTLTLTGLPPGPRGMVKIAVTFELGAEGLLTVTARELNTGRKVQAVMSAKEGPRAARRKLDEAAGADAARAQSGVFPAPVAGAEPASGVGGFLRKLFSKRDEAR